MKSRRMRWAGHVERMEETNAYRLLVGKILRKKLLGGIRLSWENNFKMYLKI